MASAWASLASSERTAIVMMRELRTSSICDPAIVEKMSSWETVEDGWLVRYCCSIISSTLSERQSDMRVLKISA